MHDGQNLYDDTTAAYGVSWGVSDILDERFNNGNHNGIIVVGIDNDGAKRLDEYSPWVGIDYPGVINPKDFGGEGFKYIDSIVHSVKPYIDSNFRTLADRGNTIISGSYMGGYISLAAIFKYPQVFGKAAAFSSAIWFNENDLIGFIKNQSTNLSREIYMDTGTNEGTVGDYQMYIESNQRTAELIKF
jgi:predicted alpha/beta superfamily hydrolase